MLQPKHTDESLTKDFYLEIKTWTAVQTQPRVGSAEGREQGEIWGLSGQGNQQLANDTRNFKEL